MSQLVDPGPPFFHVVDAVTAPIERVIETGPSTGVLVAKIDGRASQTSLDLFKQLQRAFHFPGYFGKNWSAVDECLADLSWAQADAYMVVITDPRLLLIKEASSERKLLWRIFCRVAEEWKDSIAPSPTWTHGRVAFHVFLYGYREDLRGLASEIEALGCAVAMA